MYSYIQNGIDSMNTKQYFSKTVVPIKGFT